MRLKSIVLRYFKISAKKDNEVFYKAPLSQVSDLSYLDKLSAISWVFDFLKATSYDNLALLC